jgi:acyl-coenzyme A thioesterase PaaI-like protein
VALVQLVEMGESERVPKPIDFSIDYLRSAGPRETRGRAEIVKHGRRIANVPVLAWQEDPARPVAAGTGNFLL